MRPFMSRRGALQLASATAFAGLLPSTGRAASYPTGPIAFVIPLPPDGVTDIQRSSMSWAIPHGRQHRQYAAPYGCAFDLKEIGGAPPRDFVKAA
jgi:hypothetical protein